MDNLVKTLLSSRVDVEFVIRGEVVDVNLINMDTEEVLSVGSGSSSEEALNNAVSTAIDKGGNHWLFSKLH